MLLDKAESIARMKTAPEQKTAEFHNAIPPRPGQPNPNSYNSNQ